MQTLKPPTKPAKQRKMLYQAPAHVRHKLLAAHLSPELRGTHIIKSLPVRKGDTVRVLRGDHKGFEGKVSRIDLRKFRVFVEGLTREKVDGSTVSVPVHSSKIMLTRLNLDDKWRKKILDRKQRAKKPEEPAEKPKLETVPKLEEDKLKRPLKETVAATGKAPRKRVMGRRKKTKKETVEQEKPSTAEITEKKKPRTRRRRARRKSKEKTEEEQR